jgi:hypothetical protein
LLDISTKKLDETYIIKIDFSTDEDKLVVCQILKDLKIDYKLSVKGKKTENLESKDRSAELVIRDISLDILKKDLYKRLLL